MKGRKGMELRGTKIALAAVLTCLLSLTAWLGVSQLTARADSQNIATASANAVYNVGDDSITVCDGEEPYPFFTVANASKKVPAANQWVTTNEGKVYLSSKTGAAVYYFAKSTNPKIEDVVAVEVPAVPTISKVKYSASETDKTKIFQVTVKYSYFSTAKWKAVSKKSSAPVDNKLVYYKSDFTLDDLVNGDIEEEFAANLATIQKFGGVLDLRVRDGSDVPVKGTNGVYTNEDHTNAVVTTFSDNAKVKIGTLLTFNTADKLYPLRAGAVKQLKINKASVGPSVSIDYANHGIKLKRGYAYFKMDGVDVSAVDEPDASAEATITPLSAAKTIYRDSTKKSEYYVVCKTKNNKKSSTYTHVELTKETTMADASADAIVSGVYGNDSYLKITMPSDNAKTAYQYAIAKENYLTASGDAGEKFNYQQSVVDKLKWKSATINASKGSVIVKLAKKTLADADANYLYVRKAAVAKNGEFSSQVIRFTIPKENAPKWVKHVQNTESTSDVEMPTATVKYIANGVFGIDLVAGNISVGTDNKPNGKVAIGKASYDLKALADVQAKLNTASADASADAYFVAEDLKQKTNLAVSVTIKEGALKSGTVANTDFVAATTANTLKPSIKSVTESNGSVKFTFNTTIKGGNDNAASTVVGTVTVASGNAQKNITDFTVTPGTNDITISGLAKDDTVTLSSILFGNKYGKNYVDLSGSNKKSGKAKG